MTHTHPPAAVVVGIDESASALHAAEWAVEEAVDRDVRLRLVHVVEPTSAHARPAAAAEVALRAARAAATRTGVPVQIETVIARGSVVGTLVAESAGAYPDVQTHILDVPGDIPTFLLEHDPPVQLMVSGNYGEDAAGRLAGPFGRFALCDTPSSVLLVNR